MTLTTQVPLSVGSQGTWTVSSGAMIDALQSLNGEYAISPAASNNMYVTSPSFASIVQSDTIQSVTIRVRARTGNVGQASQITVGYYTLAGGSIMYNDDPGSGYTSVSSDGSWAWYDFVYTVNPSTGLAWQVSGLPGGGEWTRVYLRYYAPGLVHVDRMEIVVDHIGSGNPGNVLNTSAGVYVGSTSASRVYKGSAIVWGSAP